MSITSYVTIREAALILGMKPDAVAKHVSRGTLPSRKIGSARMILRSRVEKFKPGKVGNPNFGKKVEE